MINETSDKKIKKSNNSYKILSNINDNELELENKENITDHNLIVQNNSFNEESTKNYSINENEDDSDDLNITNQIVEHKSNEKIISWYHSLNNLTNFSEYESDTIKLLDRKTVRILTYNIFLRPPGINNNGNDWKNERLEDFISILHNYDVICLQEIFGQMNNRKEYLLRRATKAGFFYYIDTCTPPFISKHALDSGLLILSRFPIELFAFHEFSYGVEIDSVVRKGVIYSKLKISDQILHLFCTHVQSSYFNISQNLFLACYESRCSQLNQINEFIKAVIDKTNFNENDKIILLGDFNVDALGFKYKRPDRELDYNLVKKEYNELIERLNQNGLETIDLYKTHKGYSPITYADIDPDTLTTETVLTLVDDIEAQMSLDYIFEVKYNGQYNENSVLKIDYDSLKIEDFRISSNPMLTHIEKNTRPYNQLSDHYGLSIELKLNNQNNEK